MKQKLSITIEEESIKLIEEESIKLIDEAVKEGTFRNKSHTIEFSINKILKEK